MQVDSRLIYQPLGAKFASDNPINVERNDVPTLVGGRIIFARKAINLTQGGLASKLGIHRSTLGTFENGESEPGASEIYAIASACEVTPAWLLTGFDSPDNYIGLNKAEDFLLLATMLPLKERKKLLKLMLDDCLKDS